MALFVVLAAGVSALTHRNVITLPYLISFPFLGVIAAMGFELSFDILRAGQTERQLRISDSALQESEVRMSLAASAGNLGLWTWNIPRNDIWLNDTARTLFGITDSTPLNLSAFLETVHADDRREMHERIQSALSRKDEYESEYRLLSRNGETRWVAGYGRVEFNEQGEPAVLRSVSRDITKRKLAEEALRESEARFRTVADVAPVMIWMSGPDKEGIFFNKGWLEFTGRTVDQELGEGWLKRGSRRRPGEYPRRLRDGLWETRTIHRRVSFASQGWGISLGAGLGDAALRCGRGLSRLHRFLHRHWRTQTGGAGSSAPIAGTRPRGAPCFDGRTGRLTRA